jgi:hypothetical protein
LKIKNNGAKSKHRTVHVIANREVVKQSRNIPYLKRPVIPRLTRDLLKNELLQGIAGVVKRCNNDNIN